MNDFILSNNVDVICLIEIWLRPDSDQIVLSELTRNGYSVFQKPRHGQRGCGIAIVHRYKINVKHKGPGKRLTHFEHPECSVNVGNKHICLCVICLPPPSKANCFKKTQYVLNSGLITLTILPSSQKNW